MSLFWSMAAMLGQLRRCRAYAPTSNTASQDNHEKINSWVSFIFPLHDEYGAPLGGPSGRRSSAIKLVAEERWSQLEVQLYLFIKYYMYQFLLK